MSILLIIFSFVFTIVNLYIFEGKINKYQTGIFRIAFIKTAIIHGILITLSTEILSVWQSLNFANIFIFWSICLLINLIRLRTKFVKQTYVDFIGKISLAFKNKISIIIFTILSICLLTAVIAPPNNWDVMSYHMPRVMHWIQNQSVAHYPTNNTRQISFPAGAAYIVTQLQIVTGNDLFANCVQWMAFLGSIIGISLITNILVGANAELIGSLVCASVPMAIMQSTTTQTDLVVTFWLVCFTYFIFRSDHYSESDIFWLSASIGLGILTKPTAIIFGFPLGIVLAIRISKYYFDVEYKKISKVSIQLLVNTLAKTSMKILFITIGSLFLSIPSYWRNLQTFGSFLGDDGNNTKNNILGLTSLISNILKNLGINFIIPGFWSIIQYIHTYILHVDINEPNLNFTDINKYITLTGSLRYLSPNEDFVGSPIHLFLFLVAVCVLLVNFINSRKHQDLGLRAEVNANSPNYYELLILGMVIIVCFIIHCLLLKWQPWGNRLLLPLVVLTSPLITYLLIHIFKKKTRQFILVSLATISLIYSLTTMRHPLVALPILSADQGKEQSSSILSLKRQDIYFSGVQKELKYPYEKAIDLINQSKCKSVGFVLGYGDIEYPFWTLLDKDVKIKNLNVNNSSSQSQPEFPELQLCSVISTSDDFIPNNNRIWRTINISEKPYVSVAIPEN